MLSTRISLISLAIVLLMLISVGLGIYISWNNFDAPNGPNDFEDEPGIEIDERPVNLIVTGNSNLTFTYLGSDNEAKSVGKDTVLFGEGNQWTHGHKEVVYLTITNNGTSDVSYSLGVNVSDETGSVNIAGEEFKLSDYLMFGFAENYDPAGEGDILDSLSASDSVKSGVSKVGTLTAENNSVTLVLVVYLPENCAEKISVAAGNYLPKISLGVSLFAIQPMGGATSESPVEPEDFVASTPVTDIVADRVLSAPVEIGGGYSMSATVPEGVKLEEGVTELTLSVQAIETVNEDIVLSEGETAKSIDIHIEGIAEDNTVPMLVSLNRLFSKGLNTTSVKMYHVENGVPVEMTLVANPVNHNEFSYDPATGNVVLCVASFSEYIPVTDNYNKWEGTFDFSWYTGKSSPYTISSADQLAGFGKIVDGTAEGIAQDSFIGKTVKLGGDIDLSNGVSLNPIGCGYVNGTTNSGGVDGYSFQGTFDGQNHVIRYLYQNGWDLGLSYCNLGGGLFASVHNATIKNLTMLDAEIVMECVEQGVIAGLAQGNCTFENITISNCSVANYQKATGGVVGEVSWGNDDTTEKFTHTFRNIRIDNKTVVGSLWGDFDAPVGGVIGARWDDSNRTYVEMENVEVACRLDVYNDVTSTYQWYAYRRAGMLIGNTEQVDANNSHLAAAPFLTCKKDTNNNNTVNVYIGNWRNYHYCQFTNQDNEWANKYPWVRVEAGENCSAYSNPRYGQPVVGGVTVNSETHTCTGEHNMLLEFNQLYGGGQGVYGQTKHEGVTITKYVYSIQYINDGKVIAETFVESNNSSFILSDDSNCDIAQESAETWVENQGFTVEFGGWVNAGSTKITEIPAGNTEDIKLYPYFNSPYTARFVDQNGNVLAWCLFHSEKLGDLETTRQQAENILLPALDEGFSLDYWEVHIGTEKVEYNTENFASYSQDVTIYPVYKFNGDVNLIPVDKDNDGDTDYYEVGGYGKDTGEQELVEIPNEVNGVPVTTVNADAFSSYDDLHSVRIPANITTIHSQSFTANQGSSYFPARDTVTLYYEGDPNVWNAAMTQYNTDHTSSSMLKQNWDNNMGDGSRVFFLVNGKVNNTMYWELNSDYVWVLHEHAYTYEAAKTCVHGEDSHHEYGGGIFGYGDSLQENKFTNYAGTCDCDSCNGATRPDAEYWTPVTTTTEE